MKTKFEQGELYVTKILDDRFNLTFRRDKDKTGEHTHFFLQKKATDEEDIGIPVDEAFKIFFIFRNQETPPIDGFTDVCLQFGFSYIDKKDWNDVFIEFLVSKKLTQKLLNDVCAWIEISLEDMDEITVIDEDTGEIICGPSLHKESNIKDAVL